MSALEQILIDFFANRADVLSVILFGSHAKNQQTAASDVDVAVLFTPENIPSAMTMIQLQQDLSDVLHQDVDLVALNSATPIFKYQIFKNGKVLTNKNPKFFTKFKIQSLFEYFDLKRTRKCIEDSLINRKIYG